MFDILASDHPTIELSAIDLAIAAGLVVIAGVVSILLKLRMERQLALAAVRTVIQLSLIGFVLQKLFAIDSPWALLPMVILMTIAASRAAIARPTRTFKGAAFMSFASLSMVGVITTFTVTGMILKVTPWYTPQYVIPLMGMILGNSLTAVSLCFDHLLEQLVEKQDLIEQELAMGATRWEAARDSMRESVRRGMIPIVNSMMVVGIVSLPGMMTGQIIAGASPVNAVKYQIMVMFMLAGATSLMGIIIALLIYRRMFNVKHQLVNTDIVLKQAKKR